MINALTTFREHAREATLDKQQVSANKDWKPVLKITAIETCYFAFYNCDALFHIVKQTKREITYFVLVSSNRLSVFLR